MHTGRPVVRTCTKSSTKCMQCRQKYTIYILYVYARMSMYAFVHVFHLLRYMGILKTFSGNESSSSSKIADIQSCSSEVLISFALGLSSAFALNILWTILVCRIIAMYVLIDANTQGYTQTTVRNAFSRNSGMYVHDIHDRKNYTICSSQLRMNIYELQVDTIRKIATLHNLQHVPVCL